MQPLLRVAQLLALMLLIMTTLVFAATNRRRVDRTDEATNRRRADTADVAKTKTAPQAVAPAAAEEQENLIRLEKFAGLYQAEYGGHGRELVRVFHYMDPQTRDDGLIGIKVTGDPHVPAGEITFLVSVQRTWMQYAKEGHESPWIEDHVFTANDTEGFVLTEKAGLPHPLRFTRTVPATAGVLSSIAVLIEDTIVKRGKETAVVKQQTQTEIATLKERIQELESRIEPLKRDRKALEKLGGKTGGFRFLYHHHLPTLTFIIFCNILTIARTGEGWFALLIMFLFW